MSERYFIELFQPESPDELLSFHEGIIQMLHDQSEPFEDILTGAHYRSWVGLSYPVFGQLEQYVKHEISTDSTYRLNFAKDHPGLYLGSVVHCVSSKLNSLEAILQSAGMSKLDEDSCSISDVQEVPSNCLEAVCRRDRGPERRSARHRAKSTKIFNIGSKQLLGTTLQLTSNHRTIAASYKHQQKRQKKACPYWPTFQQWYKGGVVHDVRIIQTVLHGAFDSCAKYPFL